MSAAIDTLKASLTDTVSQCEILGRQLAVTEASAAALRSSLADKTAAANDIRAAIAQLVG